MDLPLDKRLSLGVQTLHRRTEPATGPWLPTIDELSAIADKACAPVTRRVFPGMSGPPMWTSTPAAAGKIFQFDPSENKRVAESENDAPGIVILVR